MITQQVKYAGCYATLVIYYWVITNAYALKLKRILADFAFQDVGVEFLRARSRAILGDDPGMGKTKMLLLAAEGRTLVVAPAMVLDAGVWTDEQAKWRPDLDLTQVSYHALCQRERTEKGGSRVLPLPAEPFRSQWDTVICDEAHYIKNRATTWTNAVQKLKTERLYFATGTSIPNWAHEIYMMLKLCHPGDKRFTSYWRWVEKWFKTWKPKWGGTSIGGLVGCDHEGAEMCVHWLAFQQENLGDCFLRRIRDDVLTDLPPLTYKRVFVPMEPAQAKLYKTLKKDFIAWAESGEEVVAWSKAAQVVQLMRLCTAVQLVATNAKGSGKLALVEEMLAERHQSPTLLVCHFRDTARLLTDLTERLGLNPATLTGATPKRERGAVVKAFQAGEHGVLVSTVEVIKEGLTLTRADAAILVERSWRPSTNEGVIRRIHRIGQTRPVTVYDLVSDKTIEVGMMDLLDAKNDQAMNALPISRLAQLV